MFEFLYTQKKNRYDTRAKTILSYFMCRIRIDFFEDDKRIGIGERKRSNCNELRIRNDELRISDYGLRITNVGLYMTN